MGRLLPTGEGGMFEDHKYQEPSMKPVETSDVKITEIHPDPLSDGGRAFRLIQFKETGVYEFYTAVYEFCEYGDAESGPQGGLDFGGWLFLGRGLGFPTIQQEVGQYLEETQLEMTRTQERIKECRNRLVAGESWTRI